MKKERLTVERRALLRELITTGIKPVEIKKHGFSTSTIYLECSKLGKKFRPRRISNESIAEIRRLRIEEKLSPKDISSRLGMSYASVLRNTADLGRWTPTDGHTLSSVEWTPDEVSALKNFYPTETKETVLRALPRRVWVNIAKKASMLGIKREQQQRVDTSTDIDPVFIQLRDKRKHLKLRLQDIGLRIDIHSQNLRKWETGKTAPNWRTVVKWAASLGYGLELIPIDSYSEGRVEEQTPTPTPMILSEPATVIPLPPLEPIELKVSTKPATLPFKSGALPPAPTAVKKTPLTAMEQYIKDGWRKMSPAELAKVLWSSEERVLQIAEKLGLKVKTASPPILPVVKPPKQAKPVKEAPQKKIETPVVKPVLQPAPRRPDFYMVSTKQKTAVPTELEIQAFLDSKGKTVCPSVGDPRLLTLPPLVHDWKTRKYTRRTDVTPSRWTTGSFPIKGKQT